jgi:hypothetical protein
VYIHTVRLVLDVNAHKIDLSAVAGQQILPALYKLSFIVVTIIPHFTDSLLLV